jgi:hypothetical protein
VTIDGGRNWLVWKPMLPKANGQRLSWAITEAYVDADGKGRAKLEAYDKEAKARVSLDVKTEDFGRTWRAV